MRITQWALPAKVTAVLVFTAACEAQGEEARTFQTAIRASQHIQSLLEESETSKNEDRRLLESGRALAGQFAKFTEGLAAPSFKFGVESNALQAGRSQLFELKTNLLFAVGEYPMQGKAEASTRVRSESRGASLDEEVARLLVTLDYHPVQAVEVFAFAERFSDDYLGIQRRLETGIGFKLESDSPMLTPEGSRFRRLFLAAKGDPDPATGEVEKAFDRMSEAAQAGLGDKTLVEKLREICAAPRVLEGISKLKSRFSVGISFALFSELEQAEIKTTLLDSLSTVVAPERAYLLDPTQRFRYSIRPSVRLRLTDEVEVWGKYYLKQPLGPNPSDGATIDPRFDERQDAEFGVAFRPVREKFEVALEGVYSKDHAPARFSSSDLARLNPPGALPAVSEAPSERLSATLKLNLKL